MSRTSDEPRCARPRKVYRLTDKGRGALEAWLRSGRTPDFEQRDEGLLRLFFADAIPFEDAVELVRCMRVRAEEIDQDFRETILPLATERARGRFSVITAREGPTA